MRKTDAWALVFTLLAACGGKTDEGGTDSSSHWLERCGSDADCEGDLSCLCNVCTRTCNSDGACSDLGAGAVCSEPADSCSSREPVCTLECETGDDCASGRCADGSCVDVDAGAESAASDEAGSNGSGGSLFVDASTPQSTEDEPSTDETRDAGAPSDFESPTEADGGGSTTPDLDVVSHCGYPSNSRESTPSGIVSVPLDWHPRPESMTLNGSSGPIEPGCGYSLSEAVALAIDEGDANRELAFSYDVNGDDIEDIFIKDATEYYGEEQVFDLWVSNVSDDQLTFEHEPCDALGAASGGYHYFTRDLDEDGVPDVVAGMENGIIALRNTPSGFERVLEYDFAARSMADGAGVTSLLDVATADVIEDSALDLIVGFDRADGLGIEYGVLVFPGSEGSTQFSPTPASWVGGFTALSQPEGNTYFGEFAVHQPGDDRASLLLQRSGPDGWSIEAFRTDAENSSSFEGMTQGTGSILRLWSTTSMPSLPAVVVSTQVDGVYGLDWYLDSGLLGTHIDAVFAHADRELGGGGAWRDNQLVIDADGNNTADFVEFTASFDNSEPQQIAIHLGDMILHFLPPRILDLPRTPAMRTLPLAAVDGQPLGLLLYDGVEARVDQDAEPPMFQHFRCASD